MSTLKYKATERYSTGWSDYRGVFKPSHSSDMFTNRPTGLEDVPTDVLRNLWMVRFGSRAVLADDLPSKGDDILMVGQELANRNLVKYEKLNRVDEVDARFYYILENADGDN